MLHRDLSSGTWFVCGDQIILVDFGVASKIDENELIGNDFNGDVRRLADTYFKMLGGVENPHRFIKVYGRRLLNLLKQMSVPSADRISIEEVIKELSLLRVGTQQWIQIPLSS